MSAALEPDRPWDRSSKLAFALLVLGALASLAWLVHPYHEANVATNDAAIYIVVAKAMLAGEGYTYLGQPFTVHPPGMPLVAAAVIAWRGLDFYALNFTVNLLAVLLVLSLFVLVRPRIGPWLAFLVCALVWLNPTVRRLSNQVMSDVPGAALMVTCLVVERWASRRPSYGREILLGALIALSAYVRTVSVLLIPAILLARALALWGSHPKRTEWVRFARLRAVPFVAVCLALLVPWNIRCARFAPNETIDQNFVHSYSSGMWHADPRDPNSPTLPVRTVLERIPVRGEQIAGLVGNRLRSKNELFEDPSGSGRERGAVANDEIEIGSAEIVAGAAVLLAAAWILVTKRRASEWLLAANVALVSIYFGFQHRLVLLPFVLAVPLAVEFWIDRARAARFACAAALLTIIAVDFRPREGWESIAARHRLFEEFCADASRHFRPDARLAAAIGWHYSLFLDRPVYSLMFAKQRADDSRSAQFVYEKYALNTLICAPFTAAEVALLPQCRALPSCENLIHGGVVVRVRE
jgi:4-amino-4-deoxy-L-arabinose transferase-like glycosyltransferase